VELVLHRPPGSEKASDRDQLECLVAQIRLLQSGRDLLRPDPDKPAHGLLALGGIDFGAVAAGVGKSGNVVVADRKDARREKPVLRPAGYSWRPEPLQQPITGR
jgi:hypothetical protein